MTANADVTGGQVSGKGVAGAATGEREALARARLSSDNDALAKGSTKSKVGPAPAELEFNRFVEAMNLDVEDEYLNDEDKAGLTLNRRRMIRAIEAGSLVIDGDGTPIYTPQRSDNTEPILFHEPTGASLMAMDRKKTGADVGKMFSIMADFTRTEPGRFAGLKTSDLNICMAIATLYLG